MTFTPTSILNMYVWVRRYVAQDSLKAQFCKIRACGLLRRSWSAYSTPRGLVSRAELSVRQVGLGHSFGLRSSLVSLIQYLHCWGSGTRGQSNSKSGNMHIASVWIDNNIYYYFLKSWPKTLFRRATTTESVKQLMHGAFPRLELKRRKGKVTVDHI